MLEVKRLVSELLSDPSQIFVFPSEVAAEFWRRESLGLSDRRAIWEERFLSWDRFKEETFRLSQRAAPVNRTIRTLFAADLLHENAERGPILSSIVNDRYAESSHSFLRTLTSILPELARYREVVSSRPGRMAAVDPATHSDLSVLWKRYGEFLADNRLFEPSYDRIDVSRLRDTYHVFFPEVIEDWEEARPYLDSRHIRPVSGAEVPDVPIVRFDNSVQELRTLFLEIAMLLAHGTDPGDIALTLPRLEQWVSLLRRDADLMGIPLDIRQGSTLSEYPEARLFARLSECASSGYSLEAMKSLLLCRAYPWRHRAAGEGLIRWGIEHHCAGRYKTEGKVRDLWIEKLELAGAGSDRAAADARSLKAFYTSFARDVRGLVGALTLPALRKRLQGFVNTWLDTDAWGAESLRVFQFALNALNDLVEAAGRVHGISAPDPYSLWLNALGERLYVPRSGVAGIPVYPFRVSAGIAPVHHFIIGASQAATQVEWRPLSFLREDERRSLGIEDTSATEAFLSLYLRSGSQVSISFSDQDAAGIELPPGHFILRGRVERPENLDRRRTGDPYVSEADLWAGAEGLPERVFPPQKQGAAYFARVGAGRRTGDATIERIEDGAMRSLLVERLSDDDGRLAISPTRLDRFWECPFAFLFTGPLRIEEQSYAIEWSDARRIGSLMHEVLRELFARIDEVDGRFDPLHLEPYQAAVEEIVDRICAKWEERGEAFVPPVWNSLRSHLIERSIEHLRIESERYGGLPVRALESSYEEEGKGLVLRGRIDRVSGDERGLVLVDYKRNNRTRRANLLGRSGGESREDAADSADGDPDERGTSAEGSSVAGSRPASFQIPAYVALIESGGERVRSAAYYDIEKGRYHVVYDGDGAKAWFDRPAMEGLVMETREAAEEMARRIRSGEWTVGDPRSGCEACRLRAVCRMKYAVR